MSHTDLTAPPEQGRRHGIQGMPFGSIVTAVVLALFATLLGPLGVLQSASATAPDKGSIARWKIGDNASYKTFIENIGSAVEASRDDPSVPGTSQRIRHTDPTNTRSYINVDVVDDNSDRFVTLRLRRSDLYLMGWWGGDRGHEQYHYVGDPNGQSMPPASGASHDNGLRPVRAQFGENYTDLERIAGVNRTSISYTNASLGNAVLTLIRASNSERPSSNETRNQARAFLMMTQAVSEAARQKPIANFYGKVQSSGHTEGWLDGRYVSMENRWSEFSKDFNQLKSTKATVPVEKAKTQWIWLRSPDTGKMEWTLVQFTHAAVYLQLLFIALGSQK
ncbi:ribosome-inactivating family protein [Streptomyces sp. NPDC046909]|uniref:ribosome-inactivating family protein n=1 Tax=Streptomyces sp. NPDC046909 TaxID=3155617 RepID=UPI00340DCB92